MFVISHVNFIVNGKSESVPRDQVFPFLDVFCSLLIPKSELFHASFIHKNCFELFLPAIFFLILRYSQLESDVCRLPFAVNVTLKLSIVKLLTDIEDVVPGKKLKN